MFCRRSYPRFLLRTHFVPSQSFEDGILSPEQAIWEETLISIHRELLSRPGFSQPAEALAIKRATITQPSPQKSCKIFSADAGLRPHDGCVDKAPAAST